MDQHSWIPAFYLNVKLAGLMAIYYFFFVKKTAQSTPGVDWYFLLFFCHLLVSPFIFYPLLASPANADLFYNLLLATSLIYMSSLVQPIWRTGALETLLTRLAFTCLSATVFSLPFFGFYIWLPDCWLARAVPLFMAIYSTAATLQTDPAVPKSIFLDFSIQTPAGDTCHRRLGPHYFVGPRTADRVPSVRGLLSAGRGARDENARADSRFPVVPSFGRRSI